jgi:hypothetical protein
MASDSIHRPGLGLAVVAGALLMLLGHYRLIDPAAADVGFALGVGAGLLYLCLRWWRRRQEAGRVGGRAGGRAGGGGEDGTA